MNHCLCFWSSFVQVLECVVLQVVIMACDDVLDMVQQDQGNYATGTNITSAWLEFSSAMGYPTSTEDLYHANLRFSHVTPGVAKLLQGKHLAATMREQLNST